MTGELLCCVSSSHYPLNGWMYHWKPEMTRSFLMRNGSGLNASMYKYCCFPAQSLGDIIDAFMQRSGPMGRGSRLLLCPSHPVFDFRIIVCY